MTLQRYTGLADDDRRIARELQAMGAFDAPAADPHSRLTAALNAIGDFLTWMRWKGEISAYGCRIGVSRAPALETRTYA